MKKALITSAVISLILTGCCIKAAKISCDDTPTPPVQSKIKVSKPIIKQTNGVEKQSICFIQNGIEKNKCIMSIEAEGIGVAPCNGTCSNAKATAMARRAAIIEAYRSLAEKLYGIKINGRDTVKNMVLQSSYIRSYVSGIIRGATIEEENYKNGLYTVVLSLKLDPNRWNQVLSQAGLL